MKDIFLDLLKPCCGFSFLELRRFINAIKFNSEENRQIILGGIQTNGNLSQAAWELFTGTVIYNENLNAELLGEWIGECYKLNCEQLKQLIEGVEYNISQFDITADWENATDFEGNPFPVTDEESFKNWLSSQKRYYGDSDDVEKTKIKDIYIENFSLISGRITCDLYANANYSFLDLSNIEVSKVTNLGGIVNLFALSISNSNIPNEAINYLFDNYDFFVLRYLDLSNNQLTEFNPSLPLPNLNNLHLSNNQLTEFNHINWINFVKNNGYAVFSNNPVSVNETPTKTALLAKNWHVIA